MVLIPVMASRLMISLKKAGSGPTELRSLQVIESLCFTPQTLEGSHGISGNSSASNQEDMEVDSTLRRPRNRRSLQLR
jgi:hypothetical protein